MGVMRGTPPPPERLVTSDNWIEGPFNRWGFLHVRELAHTARIARGDGPVRELSAGDDIGDAGLVKALGETYTDGLCVVHGGRIVLEHYIDGMGPHDTHLLLSV